ncbi:putative glycosyltransferase EpsE [Rubripirellula amarantea]|uniref:Putative glycosyltransferase EpsE n=1 Tax=Rubripirellula amarantea TaxID=2527999 RepID=A0A5C5WKK1_9BACT|nr:glycosyltransferase family A protein [Rubripirellula amarantea]TWT50609.1 putative glycosyltransferase EpsE [Rubripirellula amarantea]
MPEVSIVVACYNAQPFVAQAMDSIIHQTFADWELIVVNDGSTDGSGSYLRELAQTDSRIILIEQENQGQQAAANAGIAAASAPLIARMDADDICEPDRLALQVAYLKRHPEVGLVGGQIRRLGERSAGLASNFPLDHDSIVAALRKNHHAICNPTILFRKSLFDSIGGYWKHDIAEDWDMFLRMGEVSRLANLDTILLSYRFHTGSINGRRIVEAQLYNEYAAATSWQRERHETESTFEEFLQSHRCNRWPSSWMFVVDCLSIGQYRKAIAELYGRRKIRGSVRLACALMMSPGRTLRRLGNMAAKKIHRAETPGARSPVPTTPSPVKTFAPAFDHSPSSSIETTADV